MEIVQPNFQTSAKFFFVFTFGWSVFFWLLTIVLGGIEQFPGSVLQYVGGAGPLVAAIVLIHVFETAEVRKDFWSRTFDPRRIPWRWAMVALLLHPLILLVAITADVALGSELEVRTTSLTSIGSVIQLVFFVFVFGPLPEEMGWRGLAYERLGKAMRPLTASLLLGLAWAVWHIPLFLIEGTFQQQLGFGSVRFWIFLASNVPLMVLMSWVYHHTRRSTLVAALMHFSGNIIGAIVPKTDQLALFELILLSLVAVALAGWFGTDLRAMDIGKEDTPIDAAYLN